MRPFFPFYGSKWNLARYYPKPVHASVIEPFSGAAGYSTFHDVRKAVLLDADPIIAGVWSFILAAKPAEILALPEMPEVGDSVDNYNVPQEAKWLMGFWLNRGSASPKKSRTAFSARTDKGQLNWGPRAKERIASQLHLVTEWTVKCAPYSEAPAKKATWFVDPPYFNKGQFYRVQFRSFDSLGLWCQARLGQVIACEGPGAEWLPFARLGSFKSTKGRAEEFVWLSA